MRYRRLSYRYAMVVGPSQTLPLGDIWQSDRLRLLVQPRPAVPYLLTKEGG